MEPLLTKTVEIEVGAATGGVGKVGEKGAATGVGEFGEVGVKKESGEMGLLGFRLGPFGGAWGVRLLGVGFANIGEVGKGVVIHLVTSLILDLTNFVKLPFVTVRIHIIHNNDVIRLD